ncbi:hypothetical protein ACCO45_005628 [Purpureocillium lilacinum]|uniref:Uncharacterized protein n=1 Tax=Purpureocillium lilacinum TaxID=33203 RepID=A0ACC4DVZ2_PURLI
MRLRSGVGVIAGEAPGQVRPAKGIGPAHPASIRRPWFPWYFMKLSTAAGTNYWSPMSRIRLPYHKSPSGRRGSFTVFPNTLRHQPMRRSETSQIQARGQCQLGGRTKVARCKRVLVCGVMALGTTKVDGSRRLCLEPGEMASADAVCGKGPADRVRGRCKRLACAWHVQGSKGSWYTASSWAVVGHALHNGLPRPVHGLGRRVASDAPLGLAHMSSHTRICKLQFDTEPARAAFRLADCACRVASGRRRRPPACLLLRVLGVVCCGLGSLAQAGPYSRLRLSVVKQSASGLTIWTELPGVRSEHGGYHGLPVWVQYNSQGEVHASDRPRAAKEEPRAVSSRLRWRSTTSSRFHAHADVTYTMELQSRCSAKLIPCQRTS